MSTARTTVGYPGCRIIGSGVAVPERTLTNADLERMMDTSDEWIVQRTGIRSRQIALKDATENTMTLSVEAGRKAIADADIDPAEIDLVMLATMTPEYTCPPTACRIAYEIGAGRGRDEGANHDRYAGAWDFGGACCGFAFAINNAYALIRAGMARTLLLIGADTLSKYVQYDTRGRSTAILFGDAAGAVLLQGQDDPSVGVLAQAMHSDGGRWQDLYLPFEEHNFPVDVQPQRDLLNTVQMNGRGVFKFAVGTFPEVIAQTLEAAGLTADQVDHFVCHQSNARILTAARDRFGLDEDKLHINIDRYGNTVAASIPLVLHDLRQAGKVREGQRIMFVGFGGGLTWGTSLWQL